EHAIHKRKHHRESEVPRNVYTQATAWLAAGAAGARRTLTYDASGNMQPPSVGTAAGSGRVEGEVYPGASTSLHDPLAAFGAFGGVSRTLGLGIAVPGTTITAPIKDGHYEIGARVRFAFG